MIQIRQILRGSPHLPAIQELWRIHSDTLGFFPQGAFDDHAEKKGLIAALDDNDSVVGYLAFRRARGRAVIVHLCVQKQSQGRGIARALFGEFTSVTTDLRGARVNCRSDFAASALWPRLGFVTIGEQPAKEPGRVIKRWWFDYCHPDLFSASQADPLAVIDSNILFDLVKPDDARSQESSALRADWLQQAFTLAVTPEVYSEIERSQDPASVARARRLAPQFRLARGREAEFNETTKRIAELIGPPKTVSDKSDHRQLAHAISSDASFFVTRDQKLLDAFSVVQAEWEIEIVRPSQLICKYDQDARPVLYSPARLDGSSLKIRQLRSDETDVTLRAFQDFPQGETGSGLPRLLREAIAQTTSYSAELVIEMNDEPLCLEISQSINEDRTRINVLRVGAGGMGSTLARHMLWRSVVKAQSRGAKLIEFVDPFVSSTIEEALSDVGFVENDAIWYKVLLNGNYSQSECLAELTARASSGNLTTGLSQALQTAVAANDVGTPTNTARLEKALWPARLRGSSLPSFIVPIQPKWATALFDVDMASERLFAADPALLLRFENAYYRSARPEIIRAPGRVLWYVSDGEGYSHSSTLCASSQINAMLLGSPKEVFRSYKRYGVFTWPEVAALATEGGPVMAFAFSHTAMLSRPLPFSEVSAHLFAKTGKRYSFPSPLELDEETWMALYALGTAPSESGI